MRYYFILTIIIFFLGCKRNNKNNHIEYQKKYIQKLNNDFGYKFYKAIDLYNLVGIDSVNIKSNISHPFYGFRMKDDMVNIVLFDKEGYTESQNYKVFKNYIISTEIYQDEELSSYYIRKINVVSRDVMICFKYSIDENCETLDEINFIYKNGVHHSYENKINTYMEYSIYLNEEEMKEKYPSFYSATTPTSASMIK